MKETVYKGFPVGKQLFIQDFALGGVPGAMVPFRGGTFHCRNQKNSRFFKLENFQKMFKKARKNL